MTQDQEKKLEMVRDHVRRFRRQGRCIQCVCPWYDGLCECEEPGFDFDPSVEWAARDLIDSAVDLERLLNHVP